MAPSRLYAQEPSAKQQAPSSSVASSEGKVSFRFQGCAGTLAIFILENGSEGSIYAPVQRADYWEEWKKADALFGKHYIEYKAPTSQDFEDKSPDWHAPMRFSGIQPRASIRYGVLLPKLTGEFRVSVVYTREYEILRRADMGMRGLADEDIDRFWSSLKVVSSDTVGKSCR